MRRKCENTTNQCYHLTTEVVHGLPIFNEAETDVLLRIARRVERFSGMKLLGYCILPDAVHLYAHLPARQELADGEIYERVAQMNDTGKANAFEQRWKFLSAKVASGDAEGVAALEALKRKYVVRMYDPSNFIRTLKERYTASYNERHDEQGTLWTGRYVWKTTAADPASVRAKLVWLDTLPYLEGVAAEAADAFRGTGFIAALAGDTAARSGYAVAYERDAAEWEEIAALHRQAIREHLARIDERRRMEEGAEAVDAAQGGGAVEPVREMVREQPDEDEAREANPPSKGYQTVA